MNPDLLIPAWLIVLALVGAANLTGMIFLIAEELKSRRTETQRHHERATRLNLGGSIRR